VVKPAEDAPLTCLLLARLAMEAGIPPGVINVVTGYGDEAGAALPAHPEVRRMLGALPPNRINAPSMRLWWPLMDDNAGLDQRSNKPVMCCLSSSGTRVILFPGRKGRSLPS